MSAALSLVPPAPAEGSSAQEALAFLLDEAQCGHAVWTELWSMSTSQRAALFVLVGEHPRTLLDLRPVQRRIFLRAIMQSMPGTVDANELESLRALFACGATYVHEVLASLPMEERVALHAHKLLGLSGRKGRRSDLGTIRKRGLYRVAVRLGAVRGGEEPSL